MASLQIRPEIEFLFDNGKKIRGNISINIEEKIDVEGRSMIAYIGYIGSQKVFVKPLDKGEISRVSMIIKRVRKKALEFSRRVVRLKRDLIPPSVLYSTPIGVGKDRNGNEYVVYHYLPGYDVGREKDFLDFMSNASKETRKKLLADLSAILYALYYSGVFHVDLTPRNIRLVRTTDNELRLVLLDLDDARIYDNKTKSFIESPVRGTPIRVVPEYHPSHGSNISNAADLRLGFNIAALINHPKVRNVEGISKIVLGSHGLLGIFPCKTACVKEILNFMRNQPKNGTLKRPPVEEEAYEIAKRAVASVASKYKGLSKRFEESVEVMKKHFSPSCKEVALPQMHNLLYDVIVKGFFDPNLKIMEPRTIIFLISGSAMARLPERMLKRKIKY